MKADLTRVTFDPDRRVRTVLHQQGRVQLDADLNEAQAVLNDRMDEALADFVGTSGVPRDRAGFAVAVASGGKDLTIGAGRLLAGGVAVVSQGATLNGQPHSYRRVDPDTLPLGRYLVHLEVWERAVTALEDPSIRETALGGPDTAARGEVVWQVRLADVAPGATCATLGAWRPAAPTGTLEATIAPPTDDTSLCSLPPLGGYTRSENALYRIEVHQGGDRDSAAFKWSRDNGAVAAAIVSGPNAVELTLDRLDPDTSFGFGDARFAEAADEGTELDFDTTPILAVSNPDVTRNVVTVSPAARFDASRKPKLRRWDGTFTGAAGPIALEGGLSVGLGAGTYRAGDFWLVPARAVLEGMPGTIEWPGGPQPPQGIVRRHAPLALVDVVALGGGRGFSLVEDCRDVFPCLTDIRASDVAIVDNCGFGTAKTVQDAIDILCRREETCTVVILPGDDVAARLGEIKAGQDAQICFTVGVFDLDKGIVVQGKGRLKVSGSGKGTQITVRNGEAALRFVGCPSVTVRDLSVQAMATGVNAGNLGALTFQGCDEVLVEAVAATSASGTTRASACLAVSTARTVRVRDCDLQPGNRGIGLLIVDAERTFVAGNAVRTVAGPIFPTAELLKDGLYRASVRNKLMSSMSVAKTDKPPAKGTARNSTLKVGAFTLRFATPDALKLGWATKIPAPSKAIPTAQKATEHVQRAVDRILRSPEATGWAPLNKWIRDLDAVRVNVAAQGIVVAGSVAKDVRIEGNALERVQQGIHVGLSRGTASPLAGRVRIAGNTVGVTLLADSLGERHGVFVGNCDSLGVEDNRISLERLSAPDVVVDGIRVFGHFGAFLLVRGNHLDGFNIGVQARPSGGLSAPKGKKVGNLWRVETNFLAGAGAPVLAGGGVEVKDNYPQ